MRNFLFGGPGTSNSLADAGLAFLRVATGVGLATHGIAKLPPPEGFVKGVAALGFPSPEIFAWAAGMSEFFGGILLAVGLLTRPAAMFILIVMSVAFFGQHRYDPFARKELSMMYGSSAVFFLLAGAGRFGIDRLLRRGRR
jgi:putative oxidoreductase